MGMRRLVEESKVNLKSGPALLETRWKTLRLNFKKKKAYRIYLNFKLLNLITTNPQNKKETGINFI